MKKRVRYTTTELKRLEMNGGDKTDWQRVRLLKDDDIIRDEDSPEITEEMFSKAVAPQKNKKGIKFFLDKIC
ncbi:MAG TPA: hypothetical protein EYP59_13655 [Thiotrichaceae bacterium]|nr:hypothetical protein [Thiotrichaceae bacterium]